MYRLLLIFTFAITLIGYGCNDPITIVDNPDVEIDILFTDTFSVDTRTIVGDITSTYDLGINYTTHLLGALDDPIFGTSTSSIYVELDFLTALPSDFDLSLLDSAVLVIEYDTLGFYGDTTARYDIEVRQMIEQLSGDTINSNQVWATDPTIIGSRSIVPGRFDSIFVGNHVVDGQIDSLGPQLRIPMTNSFGQMLLDADDANYSDSEALIDFINGLEISATTDKSAMMGLDLGDITNFSGVNKLRLYYTDDTTARIFDFAFRSRTASTFVHDVVGSEVEPYLTDGNHNDDDFAFYQGMSGVEVEISFPTIGELEDRIINNAELVYYSVSDPSEVNIINKPVDLATLTYINEEENRTLTTDASLGINPGPYTSVLGGNPVLVDQINGIYKTTLNLTSQFNTVFNSDGLLTSNVILTPLQRAERSSRTIIFGPGAADLEFRPVLRITYTNI